MSKKADMKMLMRTPIKKLLLKNKPLANIVGLGTLPSEVSAPYHFLSCALPSEAAGN
jgi:hypothetical protein